MTASEAIAYIEDFTWSASRPGLERTQELLAAIGDPQKKLRFVHVTGSNGKGSTCAILDSVLRAAGYRTGLYTSPYLVRFNERIRVDGRNIPDEDLARITSMVRVYADAMEDHPSQFELVTAIAMEYFYEAGCDIVVLEVGMGGALDSTNVIDAPEVAVFTNIGLEHTEYLGDTIEAIAATKGGIIKPGCDCVIYDGDPAATEVLRGICSSLSVPVRVAGFSAAKVLSCSLDGQKILYTAPDRASGSTAKNRQEAGAYPEEFDLPLLGRHQVNNLCVALETLDVLGKRGWDIPAGAVRQGVAKVVWPARFEVLSRDPLFILDGGHNPQCAAALSDVLSECLPGQKVTFLTGVLADKDYDKMLDILTPHAKRFICMTPSSPRALEAGKLAEDLTHRGFEARVCQTVAEAVEQAEKEAEPTVAFGSLYLAGMILEYFEKR